MASNLNTSRTNRFSLVNIVGGTFISNVENLGPSTTVNMTGGNWTGTDQGGFTTINILSSPATALIETSMSNAGGLTKTFNVQDEASAIDLQLSGGIGSGNVIKAGTGTMVMAAASGYTGTTTVNAGTLDFANRMSLYSSTQANWTDAKLILNSGATAAFRVGAAKQNGIDIEFTTPDLDNLKVLGTASGGFKNGSSLGLDTTSGDFTYNSDIGNTNGGANSIGFKKLGANTLTLGGTNTYTGATTVTAGTLLVNGSIAGSTTTVSGPGTLGGAGGTTGAVIVNSGGTLSPGASPGLLNTGSVTLNSASIFKLEIDSGASSSDLDSITGNLTLAGDDSVVLSITDLGATPITSGTFTFIIYSGNYSGGLFRVGGNVISDYDSSTNPNSTTFTISGNTYRLDYNAGASQNSVVLLAVPEPSAALALLSGLGLLGGTQRLRRRRL